MVDWKPASDDVFESCRIEIPSPHRITLAHYGLPLGGSRCPLNTDTVQCWINSLGILLATAQAMCQKTDRQSLKMLTNCLTTINYMLECPEIQKVLVETESLSAVFDRMCASYNHKRLSFSPQVPLLAHLLPNIVVHATPRKQAPRQTSMRLMRN